MPRQGANGPKKEMPRLVRRGNRYFIRAAIPRDLRDTYDGKVEIFAALGTSDRREAERLCRQRGAEIDAEFMLRRRSLRDRERTTREATEGDIAHLAAKWYADADKLNNELELSSTAPVTDEVIEEELEAYDDLERVYRRALSRNDFTLAQAQADLSLSAEGLRLDKASKEYRMLCQGILRAMLENTLEARRRASGDFSGAKTDPLFSQPPPPREPRKASLTLGELIKRYEGDKGARWSGKTRDGYVLIFRALEELLGKDRPVREIDREDCREIRQVLLDVAPNYTKLAATRGKTMREAAQISRALDLPRRKPESVNSYLNNLAALMNYAEAEGLIDKSPAKSLMVATTTKKKDKRQSFKAEQLTQIFSAPLYTGCRDDETGYAVPGPNHPKRGRFWVPLISLFTGMRLNECCQLLTSDVRQIDGTWCLIISEDSEEGSDEADAKRVKTDAGERYVPVHPELERIGLIDHAIQQKKDGATRLFPDLPLGANGYYSDPFSKWFNGKDRFLDKCGVKGPKLSFHSFRHTYRDALRNIDISTERVKALGGWANTETHEDYGSGFKASVLYKEISKVHYEGLNLSHLYAA